MASSSIGPADVAGGNLRDAKRALRARVLAERDRLPPDARDAASLRIAAILAERPDFRGARTILLTLPFGSEWDTRPLASEALAQGKAVALPRVNLERRMLDTCVIRDLGLDVVTGHRAIPEPREHCAAIDPAEIDWVLVPGVAFDAVGRRLGYGGGYYDRLLPLLRADVRRIAGAFDLQIVERVPAAPHDLAVDVVITPTRILAPR